LSNLVDLQGFPGLLAADRPRVYATIMSARTAHRVHVVFAWLWVLMVPLSLFMGWLDSVVYVSALSLYAIVVSHWAGAQAALADMRSPDVDL
jgi:hypothetical protein